MATLDASWSPQMRKIGELERPDHFWLTEEHNCYFFGEYTARAGFGHSSTNQIIANLKKKPSTQNTPQWKYKIRAMRVVARAMRGALNPEALGTVTTIPIPPSKLEGEAEYDPRMAEIAKYVATDCRKIVVGAVSRSAMHENDNRLNPTQLASTLAIDDNLLLPEPTEIIIIDDVITTGCSFVTCHDLLRDRFPNVAISGLFAARRAVNG